MKRSRTTTLLAVGLVGACTLTLAGVTAALWSSDLSTSAAIRDAAVLFAVDGNAASAQNPTIEIELGPEEAHILYEHTDLAIPFEVEALAQGNRGLSYTVALPEFEEDTILGESGLTIFPVDSAAACTVDTAIPDNPTLVSTPVPAVYSDTDSPTTEHWCLRGVYGFPDDSGLYTSTGTIIASHALGEIEYTKDWSFIVTTGVDPDIEPTATLTFSYQTIRAGAGS